jgi:antitoxin ParD1/3/4
MSTLSISIPEALRTFVDEQVSRGRFGDISQYFAALVAEDQRRIAQAKLEEKLMEGMDSGPGIEATDQYWQQKEARLLAEHQAGTQK